MTAALRLRIVGLGGSLAPRSTSLAALDRVLAAARGAGAATERFAVADLDAPPYRPGRTPPPAIERLCAAVRDGAAMVWSSPLYHGSISGTFKNAIDWLEVLAERGEPYLDGKLVGLVATGAGDHALQAINSMEFMVRALRALACPLVVPVARAATVFGDDGAILDPEIAADLDRLGVLLVGGARTLALGAAFERRLQGPHAAAANVPSAASGPVDGR
ncbi:MAG: NAD(P)H-dependent oxidoreductase [Kofleriaceae bacterium]|nr:NAD(P)H-dependent oxidoreductase [Myxococcales bacterium]MCB9562039.1 NAD(P)H-dependent oxidoreductase [Kofleriaceae bacterium]